jgi:phage terminase large subunit-like protein
LLPESERTKILNDFSDEELLALEYDWQFWARQDQLPPKQWGKDGCFIWNIRCGRGWGKTRTGAETFICAVRDWNYKYPNLVGATAEDVRDLMIKGESGILSVCPPDFTPDYKESKKELIWPNGVVSHIYYGSEPDKARGPQSDFVWCDETAKWQYPEETFDNMLLGLRLGDCPLCMSTSTPRPTKFIIDLEKRTDAAGRKSTITTLGSTDDNIANLSSVFLATVVSKYRGTRLGRQELNGDILDDNPDALWNRANIDRNRVTKHPELIKIVVGIDPAVTSKESSDDTGIIVVGIDVIGHCYVLGDYTCHTSPLQWAAESISSYHKHRANYLVAEVNNGGDLVETTIHTVDKFVPVQSVHASRGKQTRAEPVSSLYEQGKVHHVGSFPYLEDEQCDWVPGQGKSPNRIDALVWAVSELTGGCSGDYRGQKATAQKTKVPSLTRSRGGRSGLPRM